MESRLHPQTLRKLGRRPERRELGIAQHDSGSLTVAQVNHLHFALHGGLGLGLFPRRSLLPALVFPSLLHSSSILSSFIPSAWSLGVLWPSVTSPTAGVSASSLAKWSTHRASPCTCGNSFLCPQNRAIVCLRRELSFLSLILGTSRLKVLFTYLSLLVQK